MVVRWIRAVDWDAAKATGSRVLKYRFRPLFAVPRDLGVHGLASRLAATDWSTPLVLSPDL